MGHPKELLHVLSASADDPGAQLYEAAGAIERAPACLDGTNLWMPALDPVQREPTPKGRAAEGGAQ